MKIRKPKANLALIEVVGRNRLSQNRPKSVSLSANAHKLLSKIEVQLCFTGNHIAKNNLEYVFFSSKFNLGKIAGTVS